MLAYVCRYLSTKYEAGKHYLYNLWEETADAATVDEQHFKQGRCAHEVMPLLDTQLCVGTMQHVSRVTTYLHDDCKLHQIS